MWSLVSHATTEGKTAGNNEAHGNHTLGIVFIDVRGIKRAKKQCPKKRIPKEKYFLLATTDDR